MIARLWHGATPAAKGGEYLEYLRRTGVAGCRGTPGNTGVKVFMSTGGERSDFLFMSLWESLESIQAFAGPAIERAVYYPEDTAFLLEMEPHVRHYQVVVDEAHQAPR